MSVASEMVAELDLSDQDVTTIAEMIDAEILALVPEWNPGVAVDETGGTEGENGEEENHELDPDVNATMSSEGSVKGQLPSGRKARCHSPKVNKLHFMYFASSAACAPKFDSCQLHYIIRFSVAHSKPHRPTFIFFLSLVATREGVT